MNKVRSDFYVFEGINGSGKSTAAKMFAERLMNERGDDKVRLITNPSQGPIGTEIRRYIADQRAKKGSVPRFFDPNRAMGFASDLATLFVADRIMMQASIHEALNDGLDVVCDRYSLSTLVYQCAMIGDVTFRSPLAEWILRVHEDMVDPRCTFILDLPVEVARERLRSRGESPDDLMTAPLEHVARSMYLSFGDHLSDGNGGYRYHFNVGIDFVIDATQNTHAIVAEAMRNRDYSRPF